MEAETPVCVKHLDADVMPRSGRCRACIEESNADARPYLEMANSLAKSCRQIIDYVREARKTSPTIEPC